jgi:hypothetical protein
VRSGWFGSSLVLATTFTLVGCWLAVLGKPAAAEARTIVASGFGVWAVCELAFLGLLRPNPPAEDDRCGSQRPFRETHSSVCRRNRFWKFFLNGASIACLVFVAAILEIWPVGHA